MTDRAHAEACDAADPLAAFQGRFLPAPEGLVYLDGNSLGRPPRQTEQALEDLLHRQWSQRLIRSWSDHWLHLPQTLGDRLGEHLLGADTGQTLIADSTTVCFYKLAAAALNARPDRSEIITDTDNFPTDRYVLEGLAQQLGKRIRWIDSDPATGPQPEQIAQALSSNTALVTFSHTSYRSAHIADLTQITQQAHAHGALALWDLSHSVGALPLQLDADDVDLAVGCTYKYLNGGPGAPAFLYVNAKHHDALQQPIQGWLGRADPFEMGPGYEPAPGIASHLSGTPPILGLVAAQPGIDLTIEAGIDAIRGKSTQLTQYALQLADAHGLATATPRDPDKRGGHVAVVHPNASALTKNLEQEHDVIVDFRAPDVIRLGLSPLTTRFTDVFDGVTALSAIIDAMHKTGPP